MIPEEEKEGDEMRSNICMCTCGMDIMGGVLELGVWGITRRIMGYRLATRLYILRVESALHVCIIDI